MLHSLSQLDPDNDPDGNPQVEVAGSSHFKLACCRVTDGALEWTRIEARWVLPSKDERRVFKQVVNLILRQRSASCFLAEQIDGGLMLHTESSEYDAQVQKRGGSCLSIGVMRRRRPQYARKVDDA